LPDLDSTSHLTMLGICLTLILLLVAMVPGYHGWLPEGTIEAALEDDVPDSVALGKVKSDMVEADQRLHDKKIEWGHAKAHAKAQAMEVEDDYTHVGGFSITDILTQQGELFGGSIDFKIDPRTALDGEKKEGRRDEGEGGDVEAAVASHKNEKPIKAAKEKGNIQPKVTREERLERQRKFKEDRKKREDDYLLNIQSGGTARQAMADSAGSKGQRLKPVTNSKREKRKASSPEMEMTAAAAEVGVDGDVVGDDGDDNVDDIALNSDAGDITASDDHAPAQQQVSISDTRTGGANTATSSASESAGGLPFSLTGMLETLAECQSVQQQHEQLTLLLTEWNVTANTNTGVDANTGSGVVETLRGYVEGLVSHNTRLVTALMAHLPPSSTPTTLPSPYR
jgi:hypothetical protein